MLDQLCTSRNDGADPVECLRQLWAVSIDNQPVSMAAFDAAERMDIGMRGLIGLVPLAGLSPGRHTINVEWNPNSTDQDSPIDDRYTQVSSEYAIHIAFAPGYELQLD